MENTGKRSLCRRYRSSISSSNLNTTPKLKGQIRLWHNENQFWYKKPQSDADIWFYLLSCVATLPTLPSVCRYRQEIQQQTYYHT